MVQDPGLSSKEKTMREVIVFIWSVFFITLSVLPGIMRWTPVNHKCTKKITGYFSDKIKVKVPTFIFHVWKKISTRVISIASTSVKAHPVICFPCAICFLNPAPPTYKSHAIMWGAHITQDYLVKPCLYGGNSLGESQATVLCFAFFAYSGFIE